MKKIKKKKSYTKNCTNRSKKGKNKPKEKVFL